MEITGIKNIHPAAGKISSKKGWKLTDSLREKVTGCGAECLYREINSSPCGKARSPKPRRTGLQNDFSEGGVCRGNWGQRKLRNVFRDNLLGLIMREQMRF